MSVEMIALMEVVTRAGYETEVILGKLQTEPSAKVLHGLQGENAGYKDLLLAISAEFHLSFSTIEYNGEQPVILPELDDEHLEKLSESVETLKSDERWLKVLDRLDAKTKEMKDFLLFEASGSADLLIAQGKHRSYGIAQAFFNGLDNEKARRAAAAEAKRREPDLDFGDTAETVEAEEVPGSEEKAIVPVSGRKFEVIKGGQE